MMKACPVCQQAPHWHFARNVTMRECDGQNHFLLAGCRHAEAMAKALGFVADSTRDRHETAWDARAEELFAEYTASRPWDEERRNEWLKKHPGEVLPSTAEGWTEPQRVSYRMRLWRPKREVEAHFAAITAEVIAATAAIIAKHRTEDPDDEP